MSPHEPEWLERVLAVPGAAQSFDIANVHLRGSVAAVVNRYLEVRARLAQRGFTGPLWVTEHGYAAEPAFQSDPAYRGGDDAQARYLTQSLVGLGEAGAEQVFVTLRDQGTGTYATEGLARISEAPGYEVRRRPAFAAVQRVASNWDQLLAWRADQRRHEQLQRDSCGGRVALARAGDHRAPAPAPGPRAGRRAARGRAGAGCAGRGGWSRATGASSAGSGRCWPTTGSARALHAAAAADLRALHRRPLSGRDHLSSARP